MSPQETLKLQTALRLAGPPERPLVVFPDGRVYAGWPPDVRSLPN